ncbi:PEP-CTERM sorting domain-containing protein [Novosphingopyxis iocasae]|uniref:PEP-CTERM sorting domain-containing protein n=1 Tax=Novosphingopyxis iocasae TaxID=2762729 RepID=UPI001FE50DA8|nr:PEP-CTERM sorting domain-containing protein [Novosphingopyxis iocasae]
MIRPFVLTAALATLAGCTSVSAAAPPAGPVLAVEAADPKPQTVLFIGNSFTFGAHSPAQVYRAGTVEDLNGDGIGGVPALFQLLTEEAGLNYRTSLETSPGKSLEWHWNNRRGVVDRSWDHVVMQEYSTLDRADPGNPSKLTDYSGRFADMFAARNSKVDISLTSTWGRPDQVYSSEGRWKGTSIEQMALDLRAGYDHAKAANARITRVNPVGEAFSCAVVAGYADPNPYDGISYDQLDLWTYDHYHASAAGYYLEALIIFGGLTGEDPRQFGVNEKGADELGLSPLETLRLQQVAWAELNDIDCSRLQSPKLP